RSPVRRSTDRWADHGTIRCTPASVITSTASSPRVPLASACTAVIRSAGSGWVRCSVTSTVMPRLPAATTAPRTPRPCPSPITTTSPTPIRRTTAAWCPSSPVSSIRSPGPGSGSASSPRKTGSDTSAGEGVAEPTEHTAVLLLHRDLGPLLVTELGEQPQGLLLSLVELGGGEHQQRHAELAAAVAAQLRHALALHHDPGAGLGARRHRQQHLAVSVIDVVALGVQGVHLHLGAQRSRGHRDLHDHV